MSGTGAPRRIAIVGGGAAGALVAVNLLRTAGPDTEIVLIDRTGEFGPGVAYGTANPEHRLNVAAVRMGAIDGDPGHFYRWLREREPDAAADAFAARGTYGRYLREVLAEAESEAADRGSGPRLRKVRAEVVSVRVGDGGVSLTGPDFALPADHVVLGVGPLPAGDPVAIPAELRDRGLYVENAWDERDIERARGAASVLIIGTGLTMIDAAISLAGTGDKPSTVRAISRNGLLPVAHRPGFVAIEPPDLPPEGPVSLADATGLFLDARRRAEAAGGDWRDAMDAMRPVTPALWRRMPLNDRRWFLGNLQRVWESHRFRMAPEIAARFEELARAGLVRVSSGRIAQIEPGPGGARVTLITALGPETIEVDRVINSTGAAGDVLAGASPLIAGLIASGRARPDELLLGLDVTPAGRAIERDGTESERLSLIGSIRRGTEWESIGITEIRGQAATIAEGLRTAVAVGARPA